MYSVYAQKYLDQYEKAGGVLAYEMLGLMQQYIQKDGKRALTYYEKAAKNKFYHAYVLIGNMYLNGCNNLAAILRSSGIEQDRTKARESRKLWRRSTSNLPVWMTRRKKNRTLTGVYEGCKSKSVAESLAGVCGGRKGKSGTGSKNGCERHKRNSRVIC